MIVIGEVGLAGEIRAVSSIDKRVNEAKKLGFSTCVVPKGNLKNFSSKKIKLVGVSTIREAVRLIDGEKG
jgi:DNA repair protein RadA/Sms